MYLIARHYHLNTNRINNNATISIETGTRIDIINVTDIDYISAQIPNISLWVDNKEHLYKSTLSDILKRINNPKFIRIHRLTIVNTDKISSVTSRINGDYDIQLKKTHLILSRDYLTPKLISLISIKK